MPRTNVPENFSRGGAAGGGSATSGTVISVNVATSGSTLSQIFATSGGPITYDGVITLQPIVQSSGKVYATPASGSDQAAPFFRVLGAPDLPPIDLASNVAGGVTGVLAVANGGSSSAAYASNALLAGNNASAFKTIVPGGAGSGAVVNVLLSNGTTWQSSAITQGGGGAATTTLASSAITATTNSDNASAGVIGEYASSTLSSAVNVAGTGLWGSLLSLPLTAGDWDVTLNMQYLGNGANITAYGTAIGFSPSTGVSGLVKGDNWVEWTGAGPSNTNLALSVPTYRVSIPASTTVFAKGNLTYSVATPQYQCRLSARRAR